MSQKKWFTEEHANSLRFSYAVKKLLYSGQSPLQKIDVWDTVFYGRMMTIDDLVMVTEKDEFVYHELISHIPVCYHQKPRSALVIGGGDGGTVRELVKHSCIEKIVLCEIDAQVVEVAREYLPSLASGLDDPRVECIYQDGIVYLESKQAAFDIILVDSTDPIGVGEVLFSADFYGKVSSALKPGGIMVAQTESPWFEKEILRPIFQRISSRFSCVLPYVAPVPTYPCGYWSWTMATNSKLDLGKFVPERFNLVKSSLQYLNDATINSVFALPNFYQNKIYDAD